MQGKKFGSYPNEPQQRILMSDISILKGIGGFVIISFKNDKQVIEYTTSVEQTITSIREKLL